MCFPENQNFLDFPWQFTIHVVALQCSWDRDVWWIYSGLQVCLWPSLLCIGRWRWEWAHFGYSFTGLFWCRRTSSQVCCVTLIWNFVHSLKFSISHSFLVEPHFTRLSVDKARCGHLISTHSRDFIGSPFFLGEMDYIGDCPLIGWFVLASCMSWMDCEDHSWELKENANLVFVDSATNYLH